MKNELKKTLCKTAFAVSSLTLILTACGGGNDSSSSTSVSSSYQGPGSTWDVDLSDENFTITRKESPVDPVDLTVEGTYTRLASGFLEMTVASATGDDAPAAGDKAYAIEVPGYAMLLKPVDSGQIISMVKSGACPTEDIDANWVIVKMRDDGDASDPNQDFFGQFNYDVSTGTPSIPSKYNLNGGVITGDSSLGSGTCENGLMIVGDPGDQAAMYLTDNGGAIVQTSIDNESEASFIFGLGAKEIGSLVALQGSYGGWLFDDNQPSGDEVIPVAMTCDESGVCTGAILDLDTGVASESETVTITLTGPDSPQTGFVSGVIDDGSDTGNLYCMADVNASSSGQKIVTCTGQSPGDNQKMFNVMFVSR